MQHVPKKYLGDFLEMIFLYVKFSEIKDTFPKMVLPTHFAMKDSVDFHLCVCVSEYIIYIFIYVYIHMYIYIYIHLFIYIYIISFLFLIDL